MQHHLPRRDRLIAWTGLVATVLLILLLAAAVLAPLFAAERFEGQAQVIDGDTLDIRGTRIRLFGFDAPEGKQTCRDAQGQRYLCGSKAALALADFIGRQRVTCEQRDRDRYGRVVATCSVGGEDAGGWMVSRGHAREYVEYSDGRYADEERAAREAKRGIWQGQHEAPWDWRKAQREGRQEASSEAKPAGDCRIKGNISSSGRIYHMPGSRHYERTKINESAGERWFCSEAEAERAGWRAPRG
jgi:endonuclease YncB( thermonuclease family)